MTVEAARRTAAAERATPIWMRLPVAQVAYYAVLAFAVLFLMAPMIVLIMLSFTSSEWLSFPPKCCSVKWYGRAVAAPGFVDALILSVQLATIVTICSLILGIAAALGIARGTFRGRGLLLMALMSPLVVPSIVTGLAMFQLFFITGLRVPFWNLVIGHVVITLPYVIRTTLASLEVFDWSMVDTARVLGANAFTAFWRVVLPIIKPGVIAGAIFTFLTSFDNYTISMFLGDAEHVALPVQIFNYVAGQLDPTVAAISAMLIFLSAIILVVSERLVGAGRLRGF